MISQYIIGRYCMCVCDACIVSHQVCVCVDTMTHRVCVDTMTHRVCVDTMTHRVCVDIGYVLTL